MKQKKNRIEKVANSNIWPAIVFRTILAFLCGGLYYINNYNIENLQDVSLTILGINFAIIALNISSLLKILEWMSNETKGILLKSYSNKELDLKFFKKVSTRLTAYMLITTVISIILGIFILINDWTVLCKNIFSIVSIVGTLFCMNQLIMELIAIHWAKINIIKYDTKNIN